MCICLHRANGQGRRAGGREGGRGGGRAEGGVECGVGREVDKRVELGAVSIIREAMGRKYVNE